MIQSNSNKLRTWKRVVLAVLPGLILAGFWGFAGSDPKTIFDESRFPDSKMVIDASDSQKKTIIAAKPLKISEPEEPEEPEFLCGTDTVNDADGNTYNTVLIGNQCWTKENMRTTKYPDGSPITKGPALGGAEGWDSDNAYYSCPQFGMYNEEDCTSVATLGMLYQWSAAMNGATSSNSNPSGVQGICPDDWHLPSDSEWKQLEDALGMSVEEQDATGWRGTNEGSKMANHVAHQAWVSGDLTGDEGFGFSGLDIPAAGYRNTDGDYMERRFGASLWSSSQHPSIEDGAFHRFLSFYTTRVFRAQYSKAEGYSVRCIKD